MTVQCATVSFIQSVQIFILSSFWNASYDTVSLQIIPVKANHLYRQQTGENPIGHVEACYLFKMDTSCQFFHCALVIKRFQNKTKKNHSPVMYSHENNK